MRILWLKTELLHPVDKGGRIRTYQMLRALVRHHHVTYLALDDGHAAADARERAHEYCSALVTVPFRPARKGGTAFAFALLRNVLSARPYAIQRYASSSMRREIERLAPAADLVVCDFLAPSQNVPGALAERSVLFQHNVEAMIWQRNAAVAAGSLRRAYMREQWRRMRRFEAAECNRFAHVVAVSDADTRLMRESYGVRSVSSVSTGVDLEFFTPAQPERDRDCEILFVGSMDWMPNEDGIVWFAREVLPKVRARVPRARLTIVGRKPSSGLQKLATDGDIEVTGTVPDVRPYLHRAGVSVVPLRVGGGTRLKIYEAMAMKAPVVSTTVGAEGLPLRHGEHLLIADSADELAAAVAGLLQDRARATTMTSAARAFVERHCGWEAVAHEFVDRCAAVVQSTRKNRNSTP